MTPLQQLDFVARLADAWNLEGEQIFLASGKEHGALLALAQLPDELKQRRWDDLSPDQRQRLVVAARRAIEFGRQCAYIFGEGAGARS